MDNENFKAKDQEGATSSNNEAKENGKDGDNKNQRNLTFIVNGKPATIEKVNVNQPLHVPVQKALEQTGNTARPLADWLVKYNDQDLNLNSKVETFQFPEDAKIFMSLKSAEGGA